MHRLIGVIANHNLSYTLDDPIMFCAHPLGFQIHSFFDRSFQIHSWNQNKHGYSVNLFWIMYNFTYMANGNPRNSLNKEQNYEHFDWFFLWELGTICIVHFPNLERASTANVQSNRIVQLVQRVLYSTIGTWEWIHRIVRNPNNEETTFSVSNYAWFDRIMSVVVQIKQLKFTIKI